MTGSYPMSASITRDHFATNHESSVFYKNDDAGDINRIVALKNTLNYYTYLSSEYAYSASMAKHRTHLAEIHVGWDKGHQELGLISIPSIFYGSSIEKDQSS